jgi:hypothetical protein
MKKLAFLVLILVLTAGFASAQGIDVGDFPTGKWLDPNYDAVWEFSVDNIRILDTSGGVYFDFSEATVENFDVSAGTKGVVLSFSCVETGKSYTFTKPVSMGTSIILEIDPPWNEDYRVEMPFRR